MRKIRVRWSSVRKAMWETLAVMLRLFIGSVVQKATGQPVAIAVAAALYAIYRLLRRHVEIVYDEAVEVLGWAPMSMEYLRKLHEESERFADLLRFAKTLGRMDALVVRMYSGRRLDAEDVKLLRSMGYTDEFIRMLEAGVYG